MVSMCWVMRKLLKILILVIKIDSVVRISIRKLFDLIWINVFRMMIDEIVLVIVINGVCSECVMF